MVRTGDSGTVGHGNRDPKGRAGDGKETPPSASRDNQLEVAIGSQVRQYRQDLRMTVAEVAKGAGLSPGMLSKIENGMTSPSLATLKALSNTLNVPVTSFFRKYEDQRDAIYVPQGQGLVIERRGSRAGHEYRLLGHTIGKRINVEPYLITLTEESEIFPLFQHAGVEFIYVLEGEMTYRHGGQTFELAPGDSLFFDSDVAHGPERLKRLPIRMLSIQTRAAD